MTVPERAAVLVIGFGRGAGAQVRPWRRHIAYEAVDNGILSCADPALAQELADRGAH